MSVTSDGTTSSKVAEDILVDLKLTFRDAKYKAAHRQRFEAECMATWTLQCSLNCPVIPHGLIAVSDSDLISHEASPEQVPQFPN